MAGDEWLAAESERLKAKERLGEAVAQGFRAGESAERARIREALLGKLAEFRRHPVGGFISAEGYQKGIIAAENLVHLICPEDS